MWDYYYRGEDGSPVLGARNVDAHTLNRLRESFWVDGTDVRPGLEGRDFWFTLTQQRLTVYPNVEAASYEVSPRNRCLTCGITFISAEALSAHLVIRHSKERTT